MRWRGPWAAPLAVYMFLRGSRWLLQVTLGGGSTGRGKSRVWLAADGWVSSAALPSAVRWRQLVCQSGRSGLGCSQSTKVASSQK